MIQFFRKWKIRCVGIWTRDPFLSLIHTLLTFWMSFLVAASSSSSSSDPNAAGLRLLSIAISSLIFPMRSSADLIGSCCMCKSLPSLCRSFREPELRPLSTASSYLIFSIRSSGVFIGSCWRCTSLCWPVLLKHN